MTEGEDGKIIDTGKNVPTVKERLEAMSQYVVMDSDSAEKTEALILSHIDKIRKYREELPDKMQAWQEHERGRGNPRKYFTVTKRVSS